MFKRISLGLAAAILSVLAALMPRGTVQTVRAMWRIVVGQNRRGQIVNNWARVAIVVFIVGVVAPIVAWPFVLVGVSALDWYFGTIWITTSVALLPLVALPVFLIAGALALPLLSGILVLIPGIRTFIGWLSVVVFGELVIGLVVAVLRLWNDPGLIPSFLLLVVVLGMFLVLKQYRGWQGRLVRWSTTALVLGIAVVTAIFAFGGRERVRQLPGRAAQAVSQIQLPGAQPFTINADEEKPTVYMGTTAELEIQANKKWIGFSYKTDGTRVPIEMPAGSSRWRAAPPAGHLYVKGVEDGTHLAIRVR